MLFCSNGPIENNASGVLVPSFQWSPLSAAKSKAATNGTVPVPVFAKFKVNVDLYLVPLGLPLTIWAVPDVNPLFAAVTV